MTKAKMLFALTVLACMFGVSTASALAGEYESEAAGKAIGANHVFTVTGGSVTCEESEYTWTLVGKATTLQVVPKYSKCKVTGGSFKGVSATVTVNAGCEYHFGEPKLIEAKETNLEGTVEVGKGCSITITVTFVFTCEMKVVGPQGPLSKVVGTDLKKAPNEAELKAEVSGITYTANSACSAGGISSGTNGKYTGTTVVKGIVAK